MAGGLVSASPAASLVSPDDQRVTFVELFFDLVFVFSVTQIVHLLHDGVSWGAVAESVLVFWLVWWGWTQFTWALNAANTDHPKVELWTLVATAVAFFMAVSVPGAFGPRALWFAIPYVALRGIGLHVYWWVAADEAHRTAVRIFAMASVAGLAAVLAGAAIGGSAQYWIWGVAILLDVLAAARGGREEGWHLHPDHFVERHGLIVIIALGESLIVAAAGLVDAPADPRLITVGILAVALTCALWWSYFPSLRPQLEHAMRETSGARQSTLARDAFSLAHFPMLCGIVGVAAAIEASIAHPEAPLEAGWRLALGTGVFLFLGGSALAAWRAHGRLPLARTVLGGATAAAVFALATVPPWGSLIVAILGVASLAVAERTPSQGPAIS
jgi:low temperature requirement protein LtrA